MNKIILCWIAFFCAACATTSHVAEEGRNLDILFPVYTGSLPDRASYESLGTVRGEYEMKPFGEAIDTAREKALDELVKQAGELGADAVIHVRSDNSGRLVAYEGEAVRGRRQR